MLNEWMEKHILHLLGQITANSKSQMKLPQWSTHILMLILSDSHLWERVCVCLCVYVPPNRSRGRSGAPDSGLQRDFFLPFVYGHSRHVQPRVGKAWRRYFFRFKECCCFLGNSTYCDFHVAKLADGTEAASLLPEVADGLVAHSCLTVSERAAVSL